jgi:hypothetical protein
VPLVNREWSAQDRRRKPDLLQGEASVRITVCEFPDDELTRTDSAHPVVTIEVDLAEADLAKLTYPRNVEDAPGFLEAIS